MIGLTAGIADCFAAWQPPRARCGEADFLPTFYHCAPLLPTLCPDCRWLRKHVKNNCLQNEEYLWKFGARRSSVVVFAPDTTISSGDARNISYR